jgi:tripartite-type tricarboxylate transporter receptor subunit TctC
MKSLADYVAAAKAAPGQLNYGSAGVGSNLHLAMELLKYRTGIQVTHVPYKGVGPALQDTLAGHVMSMISNIPSSKPHIDKGSLRALAVTSLKRSPALPDVPTMSDEGVKDYEVLNWFGVFAPAGTPLAIRSRVASEISRILSLPEVRERLATLGAEPAFMGPDEFAAFARQYVADTRKLGEQIGIQPQ